MDHSDLSTKEARSRQLPGSDVFRYSHIIYLDEFHRDWSVVALNREGYKAFTDTILVGERAELMAEQEVLRKWLDQGGFCSSQRPSWSAAGLRQLEYMNYEYLKLACGFELHLKARLLSQDYIVQEVDSSASGYKTLAKEQKRRPVTKSELFSIDSFRYNGKENYLPGLKPTSLKFSLLTDNAEYLKIIGLPTESIEIIRDYRNLRNQIHFPGDAIVTPGLQQFKGKHILEFILDFINEEIVGWSNRIITNRKFTFPQLATLD